MARRSVLLLVAFLIALAGTTMIVLYVQGIDARAAADQELVEVLVATETIDTGESVTDAQEAGKIEKSDYADVLEPAIDQLIADTGQVRFVYVLGDEFDGYSAGASWSDAKLGVEHATKWTRVAVVTDHDWARHVISMFGWMIPGKVKTFALAEEQQAIDWAAA